MVQRGLDYWRVHGCDRERKQLRRSSSLPVGLLRETAQEVVQVELMKLDRGAYLRFVFGQETSELSQALVLGQLTDEGCTPSGQIVTSELIPSRKQQQRLLIRALPHQAPGCLLTELTKDVGALLPVENLIPSVPLLTGDYRGIAPGGSDVTGDLLFELVRHDIWVERVGDESLKVDLDELRALGGVHFAPALSGVVERMRISRRFAFAELLAIDP